MLVGNGNAFDSAGVKIRENCKLGQIPAYVVSPQAVDAKLQVQSDARSRRTRSTTARMRLLADAYPDTKTGGVGIAGSTLASLIPTGLKAQEYLQGRRHQGRRCCRASRCRSTTTGPTSSSSSSSGAAGLYQVTAQDPTPIVQAMKNVGYNPALGRSTASSSTGRRPPRPPRRSAPSRRATCSSRRCRSSWRTSTRCCSRPRTSSTAAVPNAKLTSFTLSSMSAWLLWAQSAKACGSNLTVGLRAARRRRANSTGPPAGSTRRRT